jgi:hypothetical protein
LTQKSWKDCLRDLESELTETAAAGALATDQDLLPVLYTKTEYVPPLAG